MPNNPVELPAHSAGVVVVPVLDACGPQLTGSVRRTKEGTRVVLSPALVAVNAIATSNEGGAQ